MTNLPALVTLIIYGGVLFAIGFWASKKTRSAESFLLGGRNLGPWVAGLAYSASSSSAWVLLGFSGFVYAAGPSALWMVPGILAGYGAVWLWAGPALQHASRSKGHLTLTDFLCENASPAWARVIRVCASLMIAIAFSYYVASQFQGAGVAFDGLFGTGMTTGILIGAGLILAYTFLGGFEAVSLVDTLQGIVIAVVAAALPAAAFFAAGGIDGISSALGEQQSAYLDPLGGRAGWIAGGFVVGLFATGFGALGQPHLVSWIMAARDRSARLTGAGIAIGWGLLVYAGMAILGLSARVIFGADAPAEGVFFRLADDLLPSVLSGIIAAAILSAIMSTVDSQLLVAGAAISHDLGAGRLLKGGEVLASRLAIVSVCAAAIAITLVFPASIFERTLFAWTALGASFGPVVAARALQLRPGGPAVLAGILAGFSTAVAYEFWLSSGPGDVWARTVPWAAAIGAMIMGHLFDRLSPADRRELGEAG